MENKKDLKYSFHLVFSCSPHFSPVRLPGFKFIYQTEKIQNTTTTKEIWKSSQSFLKETIEKYNNYQIPEEKTILTTYRLYIVWEEKDEEQKEKNLYETIYKIEDEEKIQIEEKKKYLPSETIQPNFYILFVPTVYIFRERQHNPKENEDKEKKNLLKIAKCAICRKSPPNVLFRRCYHLVVCGDCDQSNNCKFCPLCENNLKGTRKEIFHKKKYSYTSPVVL